MTGTDMQVYTCTDEIIEYPMFYQLDRPVAVTAPLIIADRVLVGLYCELSGTAVVDVPVQEFQELKSHLYEPKWFRLLVHGIKRIWERLDLGSYDTAYQHIADTELMAYLLDSGRPHQEYSLAHLGARYLDDTYPFWSDDIHDKDYPEGLYSILIHDACWIAELASVLLDRMDDEQRWLYFYGEIPLVIVLLDMTRRGIPVDQQACADQLHSTAERMGRLYQEITGGTDCNLWDGRQVYALLKDRKVRFAGREAQKRKEATQDDLKKIAPKYPLASKVLEWRAMQTDLAFLREASQGNRIHPTWKVMTKTSRITASNPAVQNVSKHTCRTLMRPGTGWVMLKADYRQIQMRLLAFLSEDPELVRAFREGKDVHWLTVEMCGIEGATYKDKRDKAKTVNYGILFQMTADGLARELQTDRKTAQGYIDAFWDRYAVAKKYLDGIVQDLNQKGPSERMVTSYLGRARRFAGEFGARERRQVKATVLQQLEADILKMGVIQLQMLFRRRGMKSRIVMTIHDAVYVEAPQEEEERARELLKTTMETAVELPVVPLEVDLE